MDPMLPLMDLVFPRAKCLCQPLGILLAAKEREAVEGIGAGKRGLQRTRKGGSRRRWTQRAVLARGDGVRASGRRGVVRQHGAGNGQWP